MRQNFRKKLCNKWSPVYLSARHVTRQTLALVHVFETKLLSQIQSNMKTENYTAEYHAIHTWIEAAAVQTHVHVVTFPNLLHCRCTIASNKLEIIHSNMT